MEYEPASNLCWPSGDYHCRRGEAGVTLGFPQPGVRGTTGVGDGKAFGGGIL